MSSQTKSLMAGLAMLVVAVSGVWAQACNGDASLCSKSYAAVAYATTHNAFAYRASTASNQHYDIPQQLTDGIRALMFKANNPPAGNNTDGIELCHTSCSLLDGGSALSTLTAIKTWLDANPNEVVTIIWENPDLRPLSAFVSSYASAGLTNYLYTQTPDKSQTWPTLQEMITSGKRLVSFCNQATDPSAPWLMNTYDYMFQTAYENYNASSFTCTVDRPPTGDHGNMYVLNNFIYGKPIPFGTLVIEVPQPAQAANINSVSVLGTHATNCQNTFGTIPNFVTVDFYEQGDVFQVLASLNGVTYVSKTLGGSSATSKPTTTSSSGSGFGFSFSNSNIVVTSFASFLGVLFASTLVMI